MDLQDETISEMQAPDHLKMTVYKKKRANLPFLRANLSQSRIILFPVSTEIT